MCGGCPRSSPHSRDDRGYGDIDERQRHEGSNRIDQELVSDRDGGLKEIVIARVSPSEDGNIERPEWNEYG
jgi:hypothetical protein